MLIAVSGEEVRVQFAEHLLRDNNRRG